MNADPQDTRTDETDDAYDSRMTFTAHLAELRYRLVFCLITVAVGFIACYLVSNTIIEILSRPLTPLQALSTPPLPGEKQIDEYAIRWTVLNPIEPVVVKMKLAAYAAIVLALPIILYQLCAFVFPGLTWKERRAVQIMIAGCSVLASAGVAIAYWAIFPLILPYLVNLAPDYVQIQLRLNETMSFVVKGLLGFGIAFQFPMIVMVLVYMELLTPQTLKQYRRMAIVILFVTAAILTPPDPLSMALMATPLVLLYEASIWVSYLVVRRKRKAETNP